MNNLLSTPILTAFGYRIYPLFFLLILLAPAFVILFITFSHLKKGDSPREVKEKEQRRKRVTKKVSAEEIEETEKPKKKGLFRHKEKAPDTSFGPENSQNRITAWQKENISSLLAKEIASYEEENGTLGDDYTSLVSSIQNYVLSENYWSVAGLSAINANAPLFLTMLTAQDLEEEILEMNVDRTVLFANAIDRINGGFEMGDSIEREWINGSSESVKSNFQGTEDGKRLLGCIISALKSTFSIMEDGEIREDIPHTESLQRVTEEDVQKAIEDMLNAKDYLEEMSFRTQTLALSALIYRLQSQIDMLISSSSAKTLRPFEMNLIRAIAMVSDRDTYSEIVSGILE